jgi:hypothetical protein
MIPGKDNKNKNVTYFCDGPLSHERMQMSVQFCPMLVQKCRTCPIPGLTRQEILSIPLTLFNCPPLTFTQHMVQRYL